MKETYKEIILVDDIEANLKLLNTILVEAGYKTRPSTDPVFALEAALKRPPDLFILDIKMPVIDGFTFCKKLKENENTRKIPVVFLTALTESDSITQAFKVGGNDYISKPFRTTEVLSRVQTHLKLHEYEERLEQKVEEGINEIRALNLEIEDTQREVIHIMGSVAEERSPETGLHVSRVAEFSTLLARLSGVNEDQCELIRAASPMHDIGKIGIPDSILTKPGKLTAEEWEIMKTHSELGYKMLKTSNRPMLKTAAIISLEHHEKWDGSGYPKGLAGEEITLFGRITALSDVFDALCSERYYKEAWPIEKVLMHIRAESGQHFDPSLVDLFFDNIHLFMGVSPFLQPGLSATAPEHDPLSEIESIEDYADPKLVTGS